MGDVTAIYDVNKDARQQSVEKMLEAALASVREQPAHKAVLVVIDVDKQGQRIRPFAAGVDMLDALGVLEMGKMELLFPSEPS
ncbi:MAG: hypothetical protein RPU61_03445 [Candidatus Sedimenticola sp. (ex Thyasira tokunagai)]